MTEVMDKGVIKNGDDVVPFELPLGLSDELDRIYHLHHQRQVEELGSRAFIILAIFKENQEDALSADEIETKITKRNKKARKGLVLPKTTATLRYLVEDGYLSKDKKKGANIKDIRLTPKGAVLIDLINQYPDAVNVESRDIPKTTSNFICVMEHFIEEVSAVEFDPFDPDYPEALTNSLYPKDNMQNIVDSIANVTGISCDTLSHLLRNLEKIGVLKLTETDGRGKAKPIVNVQLMPWGIRWYRQQIKNHLKVVQPFEEADELLSGCLDYMQALGQDAVAKELREQYTKIDFSRLKKNELNSKINELKAKYTELQVNFYIDEALQLFEACRNYAHLLVDQDDLAEKLAQRYRQIYVCQTLDELKAEINTLRDLLYELRKLYIDNSKLGEVACSH